jgi:RNA polymerase sigma-70 factor (ECF subfamily)
MPEADEPRGLLALMLLQHSRRDARLVDGELVTLEHQDRDRWDLAAVAEALALTGPAGAPGPYRLQAELAAVHARARTAEETDWPAVVRLYDALLDRQPTPVVALNRAVAVGMAHGPDAGLRALDGLADERSLRGFHLVPAARGDLLARAGRTTEARAALQQAAALAPTEQERRALRRRAAEIG